MTGAEMPISGSEEAENLGAQVRRHRLAAALTQERLAEKAGISSAGVAAIESGRRRSPRLTTISLLADALGLDPAQRASLAAAASGGASGSIGTPDSTGAPGTAARGAAGSWAPDVEPPPVRAPFAPIGGWQTPFVGRTSQLAALESAWSHRRRVVLIQGQAGVGKTRLTDQFATSVQAKEVAVLSGRWTSDWLGAYAGFVAPLRQALDQLDPSDISGLGELVRLVPELSDRLAPGERPSRADGNVERRLLFEAVAVVLDRLGPVLVLLDDLQWADPDSLALLAYLAGQPLRDLVVLATVRSSDLPVATAGALADLGRACEVDRIVLEGLDSAELNLLVQHIAGDAASPRLVAAVEAASEGNTFYAEELTEHLLHLTGELSAGTTADEIIPLPERIREMVGRRVATLSPDAQALLRAGAVLGRDFDSRLAARLAELSDSEAITAAEDALLSGLVNEASPPVLSFSHALVRATVDDGLSALRRIDLHRRAASALADDDPSQPDAVAQVARHWAAVADVDDSAARSAAYWTVRAGDAALASAAVEEAVSRYERATRLWVRSTTEHTETLISLGNALYASGRRSEADDRFHEAFHLAQGLGDETLVARAALGLAKAFATGEIDAERASALETALGGLPATDVVLRPAVAGMLMRQLLFDRSPEATERHDELRDEVGRAVRSDEVSPELLLILASEQDFIPVPEPEPLNRISRLTIAVARERRDLFALANAWWMQAWSALERADPEDWSTAVSSYDQVAHELQLPNQTGLAASLRSTAAQVEGRLEEARMLSESAATDLTRSGNPSARTSSLGRLVLIGWDDGQAGELLPLITSLARDFTNVATFQAGLALTAALAGDHELARRLLDGAAGNGFHRIRTDVEWPAVISFYAHACALTGAVEHAAPLYDALVASPASAVRCGELMGWWGPVDHHLGALCRLLGRWEEASERLQHALEIERAMQSGHFLVRTTEELRALPRRE